MLSEQLKTLDVQKKPYQVRVVAPGIDRIYRVIGHDEVSLTVIDAITERQGYIQLANTSLVEVIL